MYLKKLEIFGFKSFADKVSLLFEPGIIAIVGPNGCGKTNVSDAIRWVLGEQSAKQLRGTKMEDIIFNGSRSRQPVSMAEVSLTLDNSQNVIPVDYSEVTITRRVFRSGDTEYFINKNACRLKDITELFMDTGIGNNAYSLMEESKIDLILSSKSEDRRFLFEEAAGIMKYKIRRNEALNKLEKTEQNLARLGDIIQEIKSRISSLDYQVKKARQYQNCKNEIKKIEIDFLVYELNEFKKSLTLTIEEFNRCRDEIEKLTVLINQEDANIAQIKLDLATEEEKMLAVQKDMFRINSELERTEERISNLKEKQNNLKTEETELSEVIKAEEEKGQKVKSENIDIDKEILNLTLEIKAKEENLSNKEEIFKKQNEEMENLSKDLDTAKDNTFNLLNEMAHRRNEMTAFSVTVKNIETQNVKLKQEKQELELHKDEVQKELEQIKNSLAIQEQELKNKLETKSLIIKEIGDRKKSHSYINDEFEKIKEEFRIKSSQAELLEKLQTSFEGYDAGVREILNQNLPGIHTTVTSLFDVKQPEFEVAIEQAIGEQIQYIIAQNIESVRGALNYINQQSAGQVNFLVLDNFSNYKISDKLTIDEGRIIAKAIDLVTFDDKYRSVMEYLLGNVLVVDTLNTALEITSSNHFRGKVVTLKGELIENILENTLILRGGNREKGSTFLGRKREIKELKELMPNIFANMNKLKHDKEITEQELNSQISKLEDLNLNIQKIEADFDNCRKRYEGLQQEKQRIDKQIETLLIEENQWTEEYKQKDTAINKLNELITRIEQNNTECQQRIDTLEKEIQDKFKLNRQLNEQIITIKVNLAQQKQKKEALLYEVNRTKEDFGEIIKSLEEKRIKIFSIADKFVELTKLSSEEVVKIENLFTEKTGIEKLLNEIQENRQQLLITLQEKENSLRSQRGHIEKLRIDFNQKELINAQSNAQIGQIKKRLEEDYGVKEEVTSSNIEDFEEKKLELNKLKKKIESIGPVNLVAIDEYQELDERYKFLIKQQEDLVKAKEDLNKVIDKTNATACIHFKENFDKIRTNFVEICRQLFEGGEADLRLSTPDDLLNTGIDIIVQPPGKKLQSISLLSAGERAMTAIALLFSIFMVKPSPFCVLDEIDAPLDEANLQRFIMMLKEFSRNSQFIVITHNKRTMGMADVLYGVTMEEFGVSKLVSVKLKKTEVQETVEAAV